VHLLLILLVCIHSYLKLVLRYNFLFSIPVIRALYIYVSEDVRIRDYFSKTKGIREQNSLGKTAIAYFIVV